MTSNIAEGMAAGRKKLMASYYFTGDMRHPCIIRIKASNQKEAVEKANKGLYDEITDEQNSYLFFQYEGIDDTQGVFAKTGYLDSPDDEKNAEEEGWNGV